MLNVFGIEINWQIMLLAIVTLLIILPPVVMFILDAITGGIDE